MYETKHQAISIPKQHPLSLSNARLKSQKSNLTHHNDTDDNLHDLIQKRRRSSPSSGA